MQAFAAAPSLSVAREGGDNLRLTVYGDSNSSIALYRRQTTQLWTVVQNFGQTDSGGRFSQLMNMASDGTNNVIEQYVTVNGQQSSITQTYPGGSSGCYGSNCVGGLSFSQNNIALQTGQSATVYLSSGVNMSAYPPYVSSNSNSSVVSASVYGTSQIQVTAGSSAGSATITVCLSGGSTCGSLYVSVAGSGSGSIWFNPSSLSLNTGQSANVNISGSYSSGNYYLSGSSNSNIVSVNFSGSYMTVTGQNSGSTTLTICQSGYSGCGTLPVTVSGGYYSSGLYYASTSLPQPTVGQYYSHYLQAAGGSTPYTFYLSSGSLPSGLSLTSGGQIYGTPQNANSASFSIRVNDNSGRTLTTGFTLVPSGSGSVLGASLYKNGQLISENQTVYMVYKGTKTGFASASVFKDLGFSFDDVLKADYTALSYTGYIVQSAKAPHPWGSWVKSGSTVYFVHELGLIPVSDYPTFLSNGGEDRFVVPANSFDFALPMLSVMVNGDPRLR